MNNYFRVAIGLCILSVLASLGLGLQTPLAFSLLIMLAGIAFCLVQLNRSAKERFNFYEQIIDAIPNPLSVTNMDMEWTFVNKAATEPLGVKREDVLGKHCSNWGQIFATLKIVE